MTRGLLSKALTTFGNFFISIFEELFRSLGVELSGELKNLIFPYITCEENDMLHSIPSKKEIKSTTSD